MLIYVFLILIIIFAKGHIKEKLNIYDFFILVSLILISGFRKVGSDYILYKNLFDNILIYETRLDIGFAIIMKIFNIISNGNYIIFIIAISVNTIILYYSTIKKESDSKWDSIFLFVTLGFYGMSFNIMKQMLATSLCFYSIKFIINKDFKKFLLIMILASCIHLSSAIFIITYFLRNNWISIKKFLMIIIILSIIILVSYNSVFQLITQIGHYKMYAEYTLETDAGIITYCNFIIYFLLILLFVIYEKKFESDKDKLLIKIVVCTSPFLFLSLKYNLFARIAIYFYQFFILLLPKLNKIIKSDSRKIFNIILCICLIVYYFLNVKYIGEIYPYQNIINLL